MADQESAVHTNLDGIGVVRSQSDKSLLEKHEKAIDAIVVDVISGAPDKALSGSIRVLFDALGIPIVGPAIEALFKQLVRYSPQTKFTTEVQRQKVEDTQRELVKAAILPAIRSVIAEFRREFDQQHERHNRTQALLEENQAIGLATHKAVQALSSRSHNPRSHPEKHNIPFDFNDEFVGRKVELERLKQLLAHGKTVALNQPRTKPGALTGMGGVGKTQIAVRYAYEHMSDYLAVCWVDAEGDDITMSFAELANRPLHLALPPDLHVDARAGRVRARLERGGKYLLILDNVEDPSAWRTWVPKTGNTRILITTRRSSLVGVEGIVVETLPREDSLRFLQGTRKYDGDELVAADTLCEELGDLAIALALARGLLDEPGFNRSPTKLLAELRELGPIEWSVTNADEGMLPFHKSPNLLRLFDTSIRQLREDNPRDALARAMLWTGGWLAPVSLGLELLSETAGRLWQQTVDERKGRRAAARLVRLGLASLGVEDGILLHRLTREYARLKGGDLASKAVLDSLGTLAGKSSIDMLDILQLNSIRPHMEVAVQLLHESSPEHHFRIAQRLAQLYYCTASYEASRNICELLIPLTKGSFESFFRHEAGQALAGQGRYAEALRYFELSLDGKGRCLPPWHPETAVTLLATGQTLARLGEYSKAIDLYKRAMTVFQQTQGAEHPTVAKTHHAIAEVYFRQGRYDDALRGYQRDLEISVKTLGGQHP